MKYIKKIIYLIFALLISCTTERRELKTGVCVLMMDSRFTPEKFVMAYKIIHRRGNTLAMNFYNRKKWTYAGRLKVSELSGDEVISYIVGDCPDKPIIPKSTINESLDDSIKSFKL